MRGWKTLDRSVVLRVCAALVMLLGGMAAMMPSDLSGQDSTVIGAGYGSYPESASGSGSSGGGSAGSYAKSQSYGSAGSSATASYGSTGSKYGSYSASDGGGSTGKSYSASAGSTSTSASSGSAAPQASFEPTIKTKKKPVRTVLVRFALGIRNLLGG